jgi:hypothetical protein
VVHFDESIVTFSYRRSFGTRSKIHLLHPFNPAEKSPFKIRLAADAGFADSDRTIIEASFTVMFFMLSPDILFGIAEKAVQFG